MDLPAKDGGQPPALHKSQGRAKVRQHHNHRNNHQKQTRAAESLTVGSDESYDMLDSDFVEELREGWDDVGDGGAALARDAEAERRASSRALLARESFVATTYGLAKQFLLRLVGAGSIAPGSSRFG